MNPKESTMPEDDFDLGELRVTVGGGKASERTVYTLAVDRLAVADGGPLYLLGVVGPQGSVKSLRASLNAKVPADYELKGVHCRNGTGRAGFATRFHAPEGQKYLVRTHPLGFGQVHALFLSMAPGFLKVVTDETLFSALKQPEYTTPILRSWVPALGVDLTAKGLLVPLFCFRCQCALVTATDADLDASVSSGVQSGSLLFRELNLVGSE